MCHFSPGLVIWKSDWGNDGDQNSLYSLWVAKKVPLCSIIFFAAVICFSRACVNSFNTHTHVDPKRDMGVCAGWN